VHLGIPAVRRFRFMSSGDQRLLSRLWSLIIEQLPAALAGSMKLVSVEV